MTDRYVSLAGPTMHTGWMKKISILEQQMVKALREITELQKQVKALETMALATSLNRNENYNRISESPLPNQVTIFADNVPPKRGPGRPRKNPPA